MSDDVTDAQRAAIYRDAFRWFRKYPEFIPNPDRWAEWREAIDLACILFDADAIADQSPKGRDPQGLDAKHASGGAAERQSPNPMPDHPAPADNQSPRERGS